MAIVDVHCHTFNGDDLPVKGFIKHVGGTMTSLVDLIDGFVDGRVQGRAPGIDSELEEIRKRLEPTPEGVESLDAGAPSIEEQANATLNDLLNQDEELVRAAQREMEEEYGPLAPVEAGGLEGIEESPFDFFSDVRRFIEWALLFTKHRIDLAEEVATTYDGVELFIPMLVDLEMGLGDPAESSIDDQLRMQAAISKVSMLGRLRGAPRARMHPFVGFDPRRPGAVDIVRRAVGQFGFVGVKVYPPMGFRPLGNDAAELPLGMSAADAKAADAALRDLYRFCVGADVPVTAHGNPTMFADDSFEEFSSPGNWKAVLDEFPDLHLNLGHFGGSGEGDAVWPRQIAAMTAQFPNLYADVGNHPLGDTLDGYVELLRELFADPATAAIKDRLMFGTDWFMVANHRDFDDFAADFQAAFEASFPSALDGFMGRNALRFLGFDDPDNTNAQRLAIRYRSVGAEIPDWLAVA